MDVRRVHKARAAIDAELVAPPSKSVTHRALVTAALAAGESLLCDPLDADDTRATRDGLAAMGVEIRSERRGWIVRGCAGKLPGGGSLSLGASGTSMRLLTAVASLGHAPSNIDGSARLRERPLDELVRALQRLGASVRSDPATGGLPLTAGGAPPRGGAVRLGGVQTSQFTSALLLIGPRLAAGLELAVEPSPVSQSYVELTVDVLSAFGVPVQRASELEWSVPPHDFRGREFRIEGDHSSASYLLAAAAVVGGRVRVRNLSPHSSQPDARLGAILEKLGCRVSRGDDWVEVQGSGRLSALDLDLAGAPDLVPTLAVLALFAEGRSVLRGIAHLRHKESDRLELAARNLRALGREAVAYEDRLVVEPSVGPPTGGAIVCEADHRMAMAFAVAGLRIGGVEIRDPACVAKSHPGFWAHLATFED
jgi:3-phosphoshikimate 1-carboxyvinyltransferase